MTDPGHVPDLVAENARLRAALAASERAREEAEAEASAARSERAMADGRGPVRSGGFLVDPRLRAALDIETSGRSCSTWPAG